MAAVFLNVSHIVTVHRQTRLWNRSVRTVQITIKRLCQKKSERGSLSLAAAFTLVISHKMTRNTRKVHLKLPLSFQLLLHSQAQPTRINSSNTDSGSTGWLNRCMSAVFLSTCFCARSFLIACLRVSAFISCVCVCVSVCVKAFRERMGTGGSSRLQELLTAERSPDSQPLIKHWHKNTATVCVWTVMKCRRQHRQTRCSLAQQELRVYIPVCVCGPSVCVPPLMRHICP